MALRTNGTKGIALTLSSGGAQLPKDGTIQLGRGSGGFVLSVDRGLVVVTREGDPEDHVVEAGAELRVDDAGRVVAWALEPSELRIRESTARPASRPRSTGAVRRHWWSLAS